MVQKFVIKRIFENVINYFFLVDFCQKLPEEKGEKKSKFVKVEERK